jgi:hypothetical protein
LSGLPVRAAVFWRVVVGIAAALIGASLAALAQQPDYLSAAVVFTAGIVIAEQTAVRLASSRPGAQVNLSVSGAVFVAVVLLFPTPWAMVISALGFALGEIVRGQRDARKIAFNAANMALSVAIASAVGLLGGPQAGLSSVASVPWVLLAAGTFLFVNTLLTTTIVSFVLGVPIGLVRWRGHRQIQLANIGLHAIGISIAGL